jgi:hypothetical protein
VEAKSSLVHPQMLAGPVPVIPAPEPESSVFIRFWMPDQVRHDGKSGLMDKR